MSKTRFILLGDVKEKESSGFWGKSTKIRLATIKKATTEKINTEAKKEC